MTMNPTIAASTEQPEHSPGPEFRLALPLKKIQLDPARFEDMYSMVVVNQLYARLFRYTPDGQIRPDTVRDWQTSKDRRTYTFKLKSVTFSDGSPLTARHIENSLKRLFVRDAASAGDLMFISGANTFRKSKDPASLGIKAIDDLTLEIKLEKPTSLLLQLLAIPDCGILKISGPNDTPTAFSASTAFSGPYKIEAVNEDTLTLKKWRESDLQSANPPARVRIALRDKILPELAVKGDLTDTSTFMTFDEKGSPFEKLPGWAPAPSEASNERFLVLNPNEIPFTVRKWLMAQINTEEFVRDLNDPSIQPAFGLIPNCLPGHLAKQPRPESPPLTLEKPLSLTVNFGENLPYAEKFKAYLTRVWKHPRIQLTFTPLPVADALKLLFGKKGQILIGAKGLDYPDGFSVLGYFRSGIESNYFHINDTLVDQLLDQAMTELDDKQRHLIYQKVQQQVLTSATVVPLAFGSFKKYHWSTRVSHVPPHPIGAHFIPFEVLEMAKK